MQNTAQQNSPIRLDNITEPNRFGEKGHKRAYLFCITYTYTRHIYGKVSLLSEQLATPAAFEDVLA